MNINELFEEIQNEFLPEELNGEFLLQGNVILWSYNLNENSEEIDSIDEDDEEIGFDFETQSSEEILLEVYHEDLEKINEFFDEIEETDKWTFSDNEIIEDIITFKIF